MITNTFYHGFRAAVANAESFASHASQIQLTRGGTVEHHIAGDNVLFGGERCITRRVDDDLAAGKPLAAIIIHIPFHAHSHSMHAESQQALARGAGEVDL